MYYVYTISSKNNASIFNFEDSFGYNDESSLYFRKVNISSIFQNNREKQIYEETEIYYAKLLFDNIDLVLFV